MKLLVKLLLRQWMKSAWCYSKINYFDDAALIDNSIKTLWTVIKSGYIYKSEIAYSALYIFKVYMLDGDFYYVLFENKMNIFSVFILSIYLFVYLNYIAYEKIYINLHVYVSVFGRWTGSRVFLTSCLAISWI